MLTTRGVRLTASSLAILGLVLTGCSADPAPPDQPITGTYDPSTATPTTETPTPTPTAVSGPNGIVPVPTPRPMGAEQSEAGAVAFNEYWAMTLDFLYATLDVEPFRAVSSPECSFCVFVIDRHGPRRDQGYVYQGGRFTITGSVVNRFGGDSATVTTIVSITELVVTDPQGKPHPESGPAQAAFQWVNQLNWTNDGWIVIDTKGGVV